MVEKFKEGATEPFEGIYIRVDTIPPELFTLSKIDKLTIDFINEINIPDMLSKIEISSLDLYGKISADGIERLKKLFSKSRLNINNVWYEK
jgi:hypothetical protein